MTESLLPDGVVNDGPVRRGDVFRFDATRTATVHDVLPGGRVQLRIEGLRNGKPSTSVGEYATRDIKTWPRLGRAEYRDGTYLPFKPASADQAVDDDHEPGGMRP